MTFARGQARTTPSSLSSPTGPGHDLRYAIDASKLERDLGWRALETFESGIEKTVRWYLDNEWWWRPLREKVYAGERLGVIAEAGTLA